MVWAMHRRTRAAQVLTATATFAATSFILFALRVLDAFQSSYVGGNGPDPKLFIWSMEWWSGPAFRSINPLHASAIWAPSGYDLAWVTTVPGPGVLMAPITRSLGPIASFNLLMLLAPVLAALSAFLLCRALTERYWPAVAGGYCFGFSSYMLAHMRGGHLNLLLVFPIPLLAAGVVLALKGDLKRSRFILLTSILLTLQFAVSTEVFATMTVVGMLALALAYALSDIAGRQSFHRMMPALGSAYLWSVVLVAPFLIAAFVGPLPRQAVTSAGSTDLLNLFVPTSITWIGGKAASGVSGSFTGSVSGQGAYVAIPLLLAGAFFAWSRRRSFEGKFLLAVFLGSLVLSLGPELRFGGESTGIPMPGVLFESLPLLGKAVAGRLFLFSHLALAVMIALWLSSPDANANARRAALVVVGLLLLLPAPRDWMWSTTPEVPRFFSEGSYESELSPNENVLVLARTSALAMVWQANAHMYYSMPVAYTGGVPIDAHPLLKTEPSYRQQCPKVELSLSFERVLRSLAVNVILVPESGREAEGCSVPIIAGASVRVIDGVRVYRLSP